MSSYLDVWLLRLPHPDRLGPQLDTSDLDEHERSRGRSFARPRDGVLYTSAHIALRRVLGAYLGLPPARVPFVREPCPGCGELHGRPAVARPDPPLHFSLSHSSGMVLVAVASATVGADVERRPRPDTVEVCIPSLHSAEREEIEALAPHGHCAAFGQVWTRKEAYLKALGTGLSRAPSADYLGADPARRPAGWSVVDIDCGPQHDGSVAYRGALGFPHVVHRLPADVLLPGGSAAPDGSGAVGRPAATGGPGAADGLGAADAPAVHDRPADQDRPAATDRPAAA